MDPTRVTATVPIPSTRSKFNWPVTSRFYLASRTPGRRGNPIKPEPRTIVVQFELRPLLKKR